MSELNLLAVIVAALGAFVVSFVWYSAFGAVARGARQDGSPTQSDPGQPPAWKIGAELVRSLVVALVLAYLVARLDTTSVAGAMEIAGLVWIGFPVAILAGSVLWESVPWRSAAIHAGDWGLKIVLVTILVTVWR